MCRGGEGGIYVLCMGHGCCYLHRFDIDGIELSVGIGIGLEGKGAREGGMGSAGESKGGGS